MLLRGGLVSSSKCRNICPHNKTWLDFFCVWVWYCSTSIIPVFLSKCFEIIVLEFRECGCTACLVCDSQSDLRFERTEKKTFPKQKSNLCIERVSFCPIQNDDDIGKKTARSLNIFCSRLLWSFLFSFSVLLLRKEVRIVDKHCVHSLSKEMLFYAFVSKHWK